MSVVMRNLKWTHFPIVDGRDVETWEAEHAFGYYIIEFCPGLDMPFQWVRDGGLMEEYPTLRDAMDDLRMMHLRNLRESVHGEIGA